MKSSDGIGATSEAEKGTLRDVTLKMYRDGDPSIKVLYKYQRMRPYTITTLSAGKIFLSSYSDLNDPFDPFIAIIKHIANHNPSELDLVVLNGLSSAAVFCLSETPGEQLLWSHYANSWRGFCVGYACPIGGLSLLSKVEYIDTLFDILLPNSSTVDIGRLLRVKPRDWSYEREWRLIIAGVGGRGEYDHILPVVEVIFGARMPATERTAVRLALSAYAPTFKIAIPTLNNGQFGVWIVAEDRVKDPDAMRFAFNPFGQTPIRLDE